MTYDDIGTELDGVVDPQQMPAQNTRESSAALQNYACCSAAGEQPGESQQVRPGRGMVQSTKRRTQIVTVYLVADCYTVDRQRAKGNSIDSSWVWYAD